MQPDDIDILADAVMGAIAPLEQKLAALEQRVPVTVSNGRDGIDGKDGAPGPAGEKGLDGQAGRDGHDGVDGAAGMPGPPGEKGEPGPSGERGPEGPAGRDGRDGQPGVPGAAGEKGLDGANGRDGVNGKDGRDVIELDVLGLDPNLKQIDDRSYQLFFGDVIVRNGLIRFPVAIYRGVFVEGTAYEQGDMVTFSGSVWCAREATRARPGAGATPWQLAVKSGRDGREGKSGPAGPQGPRGDRGNDGRNYS